MTHRMGLLTNNKNRGKYDPKRQMVVKFQDNVDTETTMLKAYKLKGSRFGDDSDDIFPKEKSKARSELYS